MSFILKGVTWLEKLHCWTGSSTMFTGKFYCWGTQALTIWCWNNVIRDSKLSLTTQRSGMKLLINNTALGVWCQRRPTFSQQGLVFQLWAPVSLLRPVAALRSRHGPGDELLDPKWCIFLLGHEYPPEVTRSLLLQPCLLD